MELNFTFKELCNSDIAKQCKINNQPVTIEQYQNMMELIFNVLQPLRDRLGKPVNITSGFRCPLLNSKVGGVGNSQHLTGCAADIYVSGCTPRTLFDYIKGSGIVYDQLINEYDQWVHVSYRKGHNRKQAFKL